MSLSGRSLAVRARLPRDLGAVRVDEEECLMFRMGRLALATLVCATASAVLVGVVFADRGIPNQAISATQTGALTETLQGTWAWPSMPAACGPGTKSNRVVGWAIQWGDGFRGNRVHVAGTSHPRKYVYMGSEGHNLVHHSTANSGLGDCGTVESGSASGNW